VGQETGAGSRAAPLRVAVVGAGAFGRNHLRVYRELEQAGYPVELAAVVDPDAGARAAEAEFGVRGFATIEECMAAAGRGSGWRSELCVPTVHHAACARTLMACGIDLLIEKPLAASLAEADEIVRMARELGRLVQVGHLERFNPAVRRCAGC
jgi:predicted dehydrogenase